MKATATEVIIVRHGETDENAAGTLQGLDPRRGRLTDRGLAQAAAVGAALASEDIERAYCSPLERAVLTLSRMLEARRRAQPDRGTLPLRFVAGLRELDMGKLAGKHRDDWSRAAEAEGDPLHFRAPGGESPRDLQHRVGRWFDNVLRRGGYRRVLVVAHGGVVRAMLTHALTESMSMDWAGVGVDLPSRNASIARIGLVSGRVVAATADDTAHLVGLVERPSRGVWWDLGQRRWRPWPGDGAR